MEKAPDDTAEFQTARERLQALHDLASEWYWVQDAEHRFVDAVGGALAAAGIDIDKGRGKTRWELYPQALTEEQWAAHRADLAARRPFRLVYAMPTPEGGERWIEAKGQPRFAADGRFLGYHGTARDVSERLRTFAALRRQSDVLQATLEHINQGISVVDAELRLIGWNRRFLELLDFPASLAREDARFEDFIRFNAARGEYGPCDVERKVREMVELARRFLPHRFRRTRPDGTVIEVIGTPLSGGGMVTTYTDVTEQVRAEEGLRRKRDFRQHLIDSIPGIFYLFDAGGRFLMWNRNFEQVSGYSAEEMATLHPLDFFEGEERELIRRRIEEVFSAGSATAQAPLRAKNGTKRPYYFTGERIVLADGRAALIGVGIDISERLRAESALARQKEMLERILEAMDQGISIVDADLNMSVLNKRFFELLDIPASLAREGARFEDFARFNAARGEYGPCDVERKVREMVELARNVRPHRFRRTRPNGRVIEVCGTPLPGGGFVTTYTDVTEQEQAQAALRLSERRYRTLVEMLPEAIFVHRRGRLLFLNAAAKRLWGLPEQTDAAGLEVIDFIDPAFHELVKRRIAAIEAGGAAPPVEQRYRRADGRLVEVEATATAIELEDGPAVLSVARDIGERKAAERLTRELNETLERRVRERTAELEAANRELESFSYSVSHDLRAPLRALDGFSHLLAEEYGHRLDGNALNYLARIRAASQRMGRLIDDLLELARVSRQELRRARIDLSALAGEIRQAIEEEQPGRQVEWRIRPALVAQADPVLTKALLDNLLRNAWKFTAERADACIELSADGGDGETVFTVRDNGAGFDPAYADKLFRPFQRLHSPQRFEGTGIGLAIVARIVHRHGGRVWAEGAPEQGAAFHFTLP